MTKLKKSNYDKTEHLTQLKQVFWEEQLDTLTTNEMFSGQRFVILAMFSTTLQ